MEEITKVSLVAHLDDFHFGIFDPESEEYHIWGDATEEQKDRAAEITGITKDGLDTMAYLFDDFLGLLRRDLESLWRRMDKLEK